MCKGLLTFGVLVAVIATSLQAEAQRAASAVTDTPPTAHA